MYTYWVYVIGKENSESFFDAQLICMCQLVIFSELSSYVNTTGTGSMHVVDSRVAVSFGCPASF
jgi:hypothetical protein